VQERLTVQIASSLCDVLETKDVAVVIDATHLCVSSRGVKDVNSSTVTSSFLGAFQTEAKKNEFLRYIEL
jgi:GTP cyclohydrolase I